MRARAIRRMKVPHVLLSALEEHPMSLAELKRRGLEVGSQHAVVVAIERMAAQGLISNTVKITRRGRTWRRSGGQ